jgi:NTP pyrophosphatase (non-canonical NTP hydrolase)
MVYGCEYVYVVDPDDEEIGDPDSEQSQELARYVEEAIREGLENGIRIHSVPKAKWSFVFIPRPRPHRMLHVVYTAEEYQTEGSRTVGHFHTRQDLLMFAQNGMTGELGEFANHLSKTYFQGHPYNREGMIEELGDLLWFACRAMDAMDVSIMDVMNINLKKLRKRYANGAFSTKASIARIDVETHQGRKPE